MRLRQVGFFTKEAVILTAPIPTLSGKIIPSPLVLCRPATKKLMKDRRLLIRQAKRQGISPRIAVIDSYGVTSYSDISARSVWNMFRRYLDDSPTKPSNRTHKKILASGGIDYAHIREQSARYRQRQREERDARRARGEVPPSGDPKQWIRELKQSIKQTNDPTRISQFEAQIRRLGGTV